MGTRSERVECRTPLLARLCAGTPLRVSGHVDLTGPNRAGQQPLQSERCMSELDRRRLLQGAAAGLVTGYGSHRAFAAEAPSREGLPKLPIGMNLAGISDYGRGFPFRNLMWGARPFVTRNTSLWGP